MQLEEAGRLIDEAGPTAIAAAAGAAIRTGFPDEPKASRRVDDSGWSVTEILRLYARSGLSLSEFWALTPRESALAIEGYGWRLRQAHGLAWWAARFQRAKRMPTLASVLGPDAARRPQTTPEMKRVMQAWSRATSGRPS